MSAWWLTCSPPVWTHASGDARSIPCSTPSRDLPVESRIRSHVLSASLLSRLPLCRHAAYVCGLALLLALSIAVSPAQAQANRTWDVNGATAGTGGTGTWDTTSLIWFNGATFQAWNNAAFDNGVFGGTVRRFLRHPPCRLVRLCGGQDGRLTDRLRTTSLLMTKD